jgi:hypothetical protein
MNIIDNFKDELSKAMIDANVFGGEATKAKNSITSSLEESDSDGKTKKYKPLSFLKKDSHLVDILDLVKNKKLSNTKIKQEIKKYLKDPDQLNEFLQSILDSRTKKGENKEATSAGAGVGAFEGPLFSGEEPKKKETKEATSSSSIGQYDAPGFEDVKMRGNNPRGRGRSFKKPQLPGGKFVQVKKKCKRFPYCNQGDIKALNIFENETLNTTIEKISKKYGLSEDMIKEFILKEISINNNK